MDKRTAADVHCAPGEEEGGIVIDCCSPAPNYNLCISYKL